MCVVRDVCVLVFKRVYVLEIAFAFVRQSKLEDLQLHSTYQGLIQEGAPVDLPVVGYLGFIPRITSQNLHGAGLSRLVSPLRSPVGER